MGNIVNKRAAEIRSDSQSNAGDECQKWRNDGFHTWDDKAVSELKNDIDKCIDGLQELPHIEIILCGGTGEGKSSLINNCMAAVTGSYDIVAPHGAGDFQITKQYKRYQAWTNKDGATRHLPLVFSDTRGFSESSKIGAPVAAIKACILGKVSDNETINPNDPAGAWGERKDVRVKASYIFLVVAADIVPDDGKLESAKGRKLVYQNLHTIREFSLNENLPVAAFLTKCDKLDASIKSDVSNLHYSAHVETKVKALHKLLSIPIARIFPIVNYTDQLHVTDGMAVQTLLALRGCLQDIRGGWWAVPDNREGIL